MFFSELGIKPATLYRYVGPQGPVARARREGPRPLNRSALDAQRGTVARAPIHQRSQRLTGVPALHVLLLVGRLEPINQVSRRCNRPCVGRKSRSESRRTEPIRTARRRASRPCSGALQSPGTARAKARKHTLNEPPDDARTGDESTTRRLRQRAAATTHAGSPRGPRKHTTEPDTGSPGKRTKQRERTLETTPTEDVPGRTKPT